MRLAPVLLFLGVMQACVAQTESDQTQSLFSSLVPDVTINVKKHPMGPDMVEISVRAANYPSDLLKKQIVGLNDFLHSEPRGVQVGGYIPDPDHQEMSFTKGTFTVDGIIDRTIGAYRINPLVQALAGAPAPWTIHGIEIRFEGETPTLNTIRKWRGKSLILEGRFIGSKDPRLTGVEYRIRLLSQDPKKYDIPEPGEHRAPKPQKPAHEAGTDWTTIAVFIVAAGAVGALVYSLLLKVRPKARK